MKLSKITFAGVLLIYNVSLYAVPPSIPDSTPLFDGMELLATTAEQPMPIRVVSEQRTPLK